MLQSVPPRRWRLSLRPLRAAVCTVFARRPTAAMLAEEAACELELEKNITLFNSIKEPAGEWIVIDAQTVIMRAATPRDVLSSETWLSASRTRIYGEVGVDYVSQITSTV
jgi:hypothetical protein